MYVVPSFGITDTATQQALVHAHPLATWIVLDDDELLANPVPFVLDPSRGEFGTLVGHVARANPVWKTCARAMESLVVFQGPQAYVSPSWYHSKREHGKVVPPGITRRCRRMVWPGPWRTPPMCCASSVS